IHDGNVLGFSVDYINTIKAQHIRTETDDLVEGINKDEVWLADKRIELIARHIRDNHDKYTRNRQYSAILTVQSIPALIKYYETFKRISRDDNHPLKVASIYTYAANEAPQETRVHEVHSRDQLELMMQDYNAHFGTNFTTDTFPEYFNHVSKNVKKGVKDNKIDVLIVVNMFLTGFDSKVLN
ncbi:type I restriction enzyme subunit R domain-containing protein, partial [Staphylococcus pseudintermedius]